MDGSGCVRVRMAGDFRGAEGGGDIRHHPAGFGNQQTEFSKGAGKIQVAAVNDLAALGQIQGQCTKADIGFAGGETGEGDGVCIFREADTAIEGFTILFHAAVRLFVFPALMAESEFRLFGFAQCIDQKTQTEQNHDEGEYQITGNIQ